MHVKDWLECAPLEVQYWMRRSKAAEQAAVGPPWIFTSSGGFSSGIKLHHDKDLSDEADKQSGRKQ